MSEFYCYEGLRDGGTFKLADATKTTIQADPTQIIGKVVTITGNGEAGYGSGGEAPLGFVEMIEQEVSNSENYVISVVWGQIREEITSDGTATAGDYVSCDGSGGVKQSETATNAKLIAASSEGGNKAIVKID